MRGLAISLAAVFIAAAPAAAQADDWTTCASAFAYAEVERACTAVIDSGSESGARLAQAYYARGYARDLHAIASREESDVDNAVADLTHAIALDPAHKDAYAIRGNIYFRRDQYAESAGDYELAMKLRPSAMIGEGLANSYERIGQPDKALAALNAAVKTVTHDKQAIYRARGDLHYRSRRFAPAIADYTSALTFGARGYLTNREAVIYYKRGLARQASGDAKGAAADIAKAKSIYPGIREPGFD